MCEKKEKCVNCRGNHKANDRKCEIYKSQEEINRRMAKEGIDEQEAKRRMGEKRRKEAERINRRENREGVREEEEDKLEETRGGAWVKDGRKKDQEEIDIYEEESDISNRIDVLRKREKERKVKENREEIVQIGQRRG